MTLDSTFISGRKYSWYFSQTNGTDEYFRSQAFLINGGTVPRELWLVKKYKQ